MAITYNSQTLTTIINTIDNDLFGVRSLSFSSSSRLPLEIQLYEGHTKNTVTYELTDANVTLMIDKLTEIIADMTTPIADKGPREDAVIHTNDNMITLGYNQLAHDITGSYPVYIGYTQRNSDIKLDMRLHITEAVAVRDTINKILRGEQ